MSILHKYFMSIFYEDDWLPGGREVPHSPLEEYLKIILISFLISIFNECFGLVFCKNILNKYFA